MDPYPFLMESAPGPEVLLNGRKVLYFAGTSYFQLHAHPEIMAAASKATLEYGIGTATTRSMTGTTPLIRDLENRIARYFGAEEAAYLPSGYLSNLAGIHALTGMGLVDKIFLDKGSHYSNMDGARGSGLPVKPFASRNIEDLKRKLDRELGRTQRPLIVSDGLFPVQAKLAPVEAYLELAEKHDGLVWIDDAHGTGMLGKHGRGTCEYLGVSSSRLFMGSTLSKAFGAYGGMIPGSKMFISQIRNGSIMRGSSAPMNAAVAAAHKGLELVEKNPEMRERLHANARYLKEGLKSIKLSTENNDLPIAAFSAGDADAMKGLQKALMEDRIFIQYTTYHGSGAEGVLRIVVFSTHTREQIDLLIATLDKHLPRPTR